MPSLKTLLAAVPAALLLSLTPSAGATCNLIDGYVVAPAKQWYGPNDAPPQLVWDIADDESTYHDVADQTNGTYFPHRFAGPFAWIASVPLTQYENGPNPVRLALFCAAGMQVSVVTVDYDDTAPSAAWSSPAPNQWVRGTVGLEAGGGDTWSGIDHWRFAPAPGALDTSTGTAAFDTTSVPDGARTLSVTSVDRAGNVSGAQTRTVRIDNTPPAVALEAPIASAYVAGGLSLAASASDAGSGVARVRFELRTAGGGAWQQLGDDGDAPYRLSVPADVADGAYELRAVAADAVGNEAAGAATPITIDRTAPVSALDALPASVAGTLALGATASDVTSGVSRLSFQYAPAGSGAWQPIAELTAAPWSARLLTTQLADGAYDLRVLARDLAGNELGSAVRTIAVRNEAALRTLLGPAGPTGPAGADGATRPTAQKPANGKGSRRATALRLVALPRRSEGGKAIVVRGVARGIDRRAVRVELAAQGAPKLVQVVRAVTTATGAFSVSFVPHFSGRVHLVYAGDRRHAAARLDAGVLRVHPRLVVRITATHAPDGSLTDPHVHGRLVPAGAPVLLNWQARPAQGGAWLLFCRSSDQIRVARNGVIDGTCHVRGLHADNRYRLILQGGSASAYLPAVSPAMVARPTR